MFKTIKNIIRNVKALSNNSIVGGWNTSFINSSFSNFNREDTTKILQKLGGYQYFCADIRARTVAKQKLRLYSKVPTGRSAITGKTIQIIEKAMPISVSKDRLSYLRGEKELSHNSLMHKTLSAEKGIVEILNHPALDVIRDINPFSNQYEFLYTLDLSMLFYGNSYFQKVRNTNGTIAQLWLAPAQNMEIVQGKTFEDFIIHYKWGEMIGNTQIFDPNDILDFKIKGVGHSQVYGVSKIETTWKYINLMDSSLAFQKAICDNTGRPDFIMSAEMAKTSSEDLQRMERAWNDRFFGPDQAGKMALAPGKIEIDVLPRTEFDFNTDKALIQAIATGFGVPEYKILGSSPINANASQQEKDFLETVDSDLTLIEGVLNEFFLSDFKNSEMLFFAFDPVIKEDKFKLAEERRKDVLSGIRLTNDARIEVGDEPVEGGDVLRFNGRSIISIDANGPNTDLIPIPAPEKSIDTELKDKIDNIISKMSDNDSKEKAVVPNPIVINMNSDTIIEEVIEEEEIFEKKAGKEEENIEYNNIDNESPLANKIVENIKGI